MNIRHFTRIKASFSGRRHWVRARLSVEALEMRSMLAADPFSIVMLPDTQKYTDHKDSSGNPLPNESQTYFNSQTQWIVDNLTAKNIKFVTHVGDVIEYTSSSTERAARFARADAAMDILDGNLSSNPQGRVPYSVVLGNHDYEANGDHRTDASGGAASFVANFGPARFTTPGGGYRSWYGGASANGANSYQWFSAGDIDFLHLALEYEARIDSNPNLDAVRWAQSVIDANPGMPVILSTHAYLNGGEGRGWGRSNGDTGRNGETIFNELVRNNPEIFMVLGGHFTGARQRTVDNAAGFDVYEVLVDYQGDSQGGGGYFRLFEFSPDDNSIGATSISNVPGKAPLANSGSRENVYDLEVDFETRIAMKTTARLTTPLDNGSAIATGDVDSLDAFGQVRVTDNPDHFVVQLADVDDGINDATVTASTVRLYRNGALLGQGAANGYDFAYSTSVNTIMLTPRGAAEFAAGDYQIVVGGSAVIRNGDGTAMAATTINVDVDAASAPSQVTTVFDVGNDTWIQSGMAAQGASEGVKVDGSPAIHGLIRFTGVTAGANRIPAGSTINSVALDFGVVVDPIDGGGADQGNVPAMHRMISSWSDSATWASSFGGNGIGANGTEAVATADASRSGAHTSSTAPDYSSSQFDALRSTVQGWVNGAYTNNGWALLPGGSSGVSLGSFESSARPRLTVTYTPPAGQASAFRAEAAPAAESSSNTDASSDAAPASGDQAKSDRERQARAVDAVFDNRARAADRAPATRRTVAAPSRGEANDRSVPESAIIAPADDAFDSNASPNRRPNRSAPVQETDLADEAAL
jgi:hypothetical protein